MPGYKKTNKRKRSSSRSKRPPSTPGMQLDPMTALTLANMRTGGMVGRFNHPSSVEAKYQDWVISGLTIPRDTGAVANENLIAVLPQIPSGTDARTRIGRQIYLKHIQYRFTLSSFSTNQDLICRVVFFLDRQNNKSNALGQERWRSCFDCTPPAIGVAPLHVATLAGTIDCQAFRALANSARYKVLLDRIVKIPAIGMASTGAVDPHNSGNILLQGIVPVREKFDYSDNTGDVVELTSNAVAAFIIPIGSNNANNQLAIRGLFRIRFLDV